MNLESKPVTGLATSDEDAAITLTNIDNDINIISNLFEKIAEKRVNVDMISQTAPVSGKVNISFTVPKVDLKDCLTILKSYFNEKTKVDIDENITKFSVVGIGMKTTSGVVAKMLKLFKENNIGVKMITTSEIRITCAIKQEDKMKTINLVAKEFNL
nr:TPA_exp: Aspartokinase [Clostridium autoethanogenum DSM 10061]